MPSNEVSFTVDFKNVKLVQEIINKFADAATRLEERNGILYSHIELLNKALDVLCPLVARTIDFLPSEQFTLRAATREALDNVTYIQNKEYRENTNPDYCKGAEKTALVRLCGVLGVLTENNDLATAALLAATRIESLEKKIPALNVDLAEASMHAYNGEIVRMKLEAELARRDEIIARLKEDAEDKLQDAQLKPKTVYTVTMYRYGNREWHSYVLGAFSSNDIAREWAAKEEEYRGGKYKAEIIRWGIDSPTDFLKGEL